MALIFRDEFIEFGTPTKRVLICSNRDLLK